MFSCERGTVVARLDSGQGAQVLVQNLAVNVSVGNSDGANLIRMSIADEHSGSIKITTHLDRTSHCKTASSTNWSNRWTYGVFVINHCRDEVRSGVSDGQLSSEDGTT